WGKTIARRRSCQLRRLARLSEAGSFAYGNLAYYTNPSAKMTAMNERRHIEREFGVPIAGDILDRDRWARTALKHLPESGPLEWEALFGRRAPVVVDVGCGNGRFLIGS